MMVNPFSGIVPQRTPQEKQAAKRKSLDDADVKACKAKFGTLGKKDQLLFRLLEATGMRLRHTPSAHDGKLRKVLPRLASRAT